MENGANLPFDNMSYLNAEIKGQARAFWDSGRMLDAGELVFRNLKDKDKPIWAGSILSFVATRNNISLESINQVIRLAGSPSEWGLAHAAFSSIRSQLLKLERMRDRSTEQELVYHILYLSESVAKVVYNGSNPDDPFDEDSGWWVAQCLRNVVDLLGDNLFAESAWSLFCYENIEY